jgi:hypothetical protein
MSICISFFTGKKTVYFFICVCVCVCVENVQHFDALEKI